MSKFKIGDEVKLKSDLKVGEKYGIGVKITFFERMLDLKGKELVIREVKDYGKHNSSTCRVLGSELYFDEEMLEFTGE